MNRNKFYFSFGFLTIVVLTLINYSGVFQNFEYRALDIFRSAHSAHPDIVIAAIDNKSIEEIGRWPWNRKVHADFLNVLDSYGPQVLAFDINFSEKQDDLNDSAFAFAIENASFPTVLTTQAIFTKNSETPQSFLKPVIFSKNTGHVNVPESDDGITRKFPESLGTKEETFLPFSFKLAEIVGANLPKEQNLLIDFSGKAGSFQTISYSDVLNRKIKSEDLKDKIILVGATASDLRDYVYVPVAGEIISGVEWHANVLDNILLSRAVAYAPTKYYVLLGLIIWLIILLLPLSIKTSNVSKIFTVLVIGLPIASLILWQTESVALPFFINLVGLILIFLIRSGYKWYQVEMEKRKLHRTIQNRFSPQVVEAIMHDPELLKLGGVRKEVTVLFSDIRNFTTISESVAPETLSKLLHEYFTEMTEEVLATDGVLDKFIGDAVMAFWGAPIEQSDQVDRAVKTGLGMLRRLTALQNKWKKQDMPFIDIGIGIHTGIATVGNMGSEKRFDYTVIGDTVNIASRLEGLNKEYQTHFIISEATLHKISPSLNIQSKPLGEALVKGKTQGVNIFEVSE